MNYTACTPLNSSKGPCFLAVGDGFAQIITESPVPQEIKDAKGGRWYAAASYGDAWLIGGEELLLWQYGSYHRSRFMYGTIRCLCHWKGLWLGGTDRGELFSFSDGFQFQVQSTGCRDRIVAICGGTQFCLAISANGWVFTTYDGQHWQEMNFNHIYEGYMPPCSFASAAWCDGRFQVVGQDEDGPVLLSSTGGTVWNRHTLEPHDTLGQIRLPKHEHFLSICWSETVQQAFITTDEGLIYVLPSCPKCMKVDTVPMDKAVCCAESKGLLLLLGADDQLQLLDVASRRQTEMDLSQAIIEFSQGALLIDVRSARDAQLDPAVNAINIPLEQLAEHLKEAAKPAQELLFLCDFGFLAEDAVQIAAQSGYYRAYNVGSVYRWNQKNIDVKKR